MWFNSYFLFLHYSREFFYDTPLDMRYALLASRKECHYYFVRIYTRYPLTVHNIVRLIVEYIFMINLFKDININDILYKTS